MEIINTSLVKTKTNIKGDTIIDIEDDYGKCGNGDTIIDIEDDHSIPSEIIIEKITDLSIKKYKELSNLQPSENWEGSSEGSTPYRPVIANCDHKKTESTGLKNKSFIPNASETQTKKPDGILREIACTDFKKNGFTQVKITTLIIFFQLVNVFHGWLAQSKIENGIKCILRDGCYLILNEGFLNSAGVLIQHCTALYVSGGCVEYFDPMGTLNDIPGIDVVNDIPLQHPEYKSCALHCVYFLIHRGKLGSMLNVQQSFPSYGAYFHSNGIQLSFVDDNYLRALQSNEEHVLKYFTENKLD